MRNGFTFAKCAYLLLYSETKENSHTDMTKSQIYSKSKILIAQYCCSFASCLQRGNIASF